MIFILLQTIQCEIKVETLNRIFFPASMLFAVLNPLISAAVLCNALLMVSSLLTNANMVVLPVGMGCGEGFPAPLAIVEVHYFFLDPDIDRRGAAGGFTCGDDAGLALIKSSAIFWIGASKDLGNSE
jgi:hypothetical protein